jgi:hypothetical protein
MSISRLQLENMTDEEVLARVPNQGAMCCFGHFSGTNTDCQGCWANAKCRRVTVLQQKPSTPAPSLSKEQDEDVDPVEHLVTLLRGKFRKATKEFDNRKVIIFVNDKKEVVMQLTVMENGYMRVFVKGKLDLRLVELEDVAAASAVYRVALLAIG